MSEANKTLVRRFYEEVFNKGNLAAIDEICSPNVVDHSLPPGLPAGIAGVKQLVGMYRAAFPDLALTIEDMIAEGDKVVVRWSGVGTHRGDLMGIAPTGKQVAISGIGIDRIANGKLAEHWERFDEMGMMQQLGIVPTPG